MSLRLRTFLLILSLGLISTNAALAQGPITAQLEPASGSSASGAAILAAEGGSTRATLEIAGLPSGAVVQATMHAGTCGTPSASFAQLLSLTADTDGKASGTGLILFRGTDDVALTDITDGEHVIIVMGPDGALACGQIPRPGAAMTPNRLPETGGSTPSSTGL